MIVDAQKVIVDNKAKVTEAQVRRFLDISLVKYIRAKIEPGRLMNSFFLRFYFD